MKIVNLVVQAAIGISMAVSGVVHAYLYVHGYRDIPTVGPAFLAQASVFCAVAVLILIGGPAWLRLVAVLGAGGSLLAFALSRTVGLFGFSETAWEPSPYALLTVIAEALTIALVGAAAVRRRSRRAQSVPT
ncbi:MAG: hypothetical protein NVS4B6_10340 [Mycobacterium sp.]